MSTPLLVDIVGVGRWGPNLVRSFSDLHDVHVRAIHDRDLAQMRRLQEKFPGVAMVGSFEELLAGPSQAVIIATPVHTHARLVEQALRAGKHVFVEKPFCATVDEGWRLVELARTQQRLIHVGHIFLFNPSVIKVKALIDEGTLGEIHYMEARRTNLGPVREDVDAIWDLASHDFSILAYWLDAWPRKIGSNACKILQNGPADLGLCNLVFDNNTFASCYVSWLSPQKVRQITVVGTKRMLVWDDMDLTRPIQVFDNSITRAQETYSDSFTSHRLTYQRGDVLVPFVEGGQPLTLECSHFIDCIRNGTTSRSDGSFGTRVVEILEASDRSLEQDGALTEIIPRAPAGGAAPDNSFAA